MFGIFFRSVIEDGPADRFKSYLVGCINIIFSRYADGLHSDIHSLQRTLPNIREPAACDNFLPNPILEERGDFADKVAFWDLARGPGKSPHQFEGVSLGFT